MGVPEVSSTRTNSFWPRFLWCALICRSRLVIHAIGLTSHCSRRVDTAPTHLGHLLSNVDNHNDSVRPSRPPSFPSYTHLPTYLYPPPIYLPPATCLYLYRYICLYYSVCISGTFGNELILHTCTNLPTCVCLRCILYLVHLDSAPAVTRSAARCPRVHSPLSLGLGPLSSGPQPAVLGSWPAVLGSTARCPWVLARCPRVHSPLSLGLGPLSSGPQPAVLGSWPAVLGSTARCPWVLARCPRVHSPLSLGLGPLSSGPQPAVLGSWHAVLGSTARCPWALAPLSSVPRPSSLIYIQLRQTYITFD